MVFSPSKAGRHLFTCLDGSACARWLTVREVYVGAFVHGLMMIAMSMDVMVAGLSSWLLSAFSCSWVWS